MVHKRDLLTGLVRNVKISLNVFVKKTFIASRVVAYVVDDEIQPVDEVLRPTLKLDECSHVVRNILATRVSERATSER